MKKLLVAAILAACSFPAHSALIGYNHFLTATDVETTEDYRTGGYINFDSESRGITSFQFYASAPEGPQVYEFVAHKENEFYPLTVDLREDLSSTSRSYYTIGATIQSPDYLGAPVVSVDLYWDVIITPDSNLDRFCSDLPVYCNLGITPGSNPLFYIESAESYTGILRTSEAVYQLDGQMKLMHLASTDPISVPEPSTLALLGLGLAGLGASAMRRGSA